MQSNHLWLLYNRGERASERAPVCENTLLRNLIITVLVASGVLFFLPEFKISPAIPFVSTYTRSHLKQTNSPPHNYTTCDLASAIKAQAASTFLLYTRGLVVASFLFFFFFLQICN